MSAKYAQAVYGNLAYNSAVPAVPARDIPVPEQERAEAAREYHRAGERQGTRALKKQSISAFSVVGIICIAALMLVTLLSYVSLTKISAETVELTERMKTLKDEETRLQLEYESALDLNAVESYATHVLGMSKPGDNQIFYIRTDAADQAEILHTEQGGSGLLDFFSSILTTLSDIFR
ncbi:MAG: hypothetical protein GX111_03215 [Clostridiales bacterium]|jgi:cell division protein FtsB|nr:hypothetical protein [Clostridiales bacterium]